VIKTAAAPLHEHDEATTPTDIAITPMISPSDCALAAEFQSIDNGRRKSRDDARENNQR